MKQSTFENLYQNNWEQLETWLNHLDHHYFKNPTELAKFPKLYRQTCQHLALARDRHYTPHLVAHLNQLVLRGHQHLYATRPNLIYQIVQFILTDFPYWIHRHNSLIGLSCLLFFAPLLLSFWATQTHEEWLHFLMTEKQLEDLRTLYSPQSTFARHTQEDFLMFGHYIKNNISIGFQTFAGGLLWGLGSTFFLIFNGLIIGAIAGHLTQIGYSNTFYPFVIGHSSLELLAIVLSGAAGLKLGYALLNPGRLYRLQALRQAASEAIYLMYGAIFLFLLAALIEAFWSANHLISPEIKYTVGTALWMICLTYVLLLRPHRAT